jgi:hypothetical protein
MQAADEPALKCALAPGAFCPVPSARGGRGATTAKLSALSIPEVARSLTIAWRHALPNKPRWTARPTANFQLKFVALLSESIRFVATRFVFVAARHVS